MLTHTKNTKRGNIERNKRRKQRRNKELRRTSKNNKLMDENPLLYYQPKNNEDI